MREEGESYPVDIDADDSEDDLLTLSLSVSLTTVEIESLTLNRVEEERFLAGTVGISLPGNSSRNYSQQDFLSRYTSRYNFLKAPYLLAT